MLKYSYNGFIRFLTGTKCIGVGALLAQPAQAQTRLPLNDLLAFKEPSKIWSIAGDVWAGLSKVNTLNTGNNKGF